jgi:hypothetical protein
MPCAGQRRPTASTKIGAAQRVYGLETSFDKVDTQELADGGLELNRGLVAQRRVETLSVIEKHVRGDVAA